MPHDRRNLPAIRHTSASSMYAARRDQDALDDLVRSKDRSAPARAFAQGLAAGAFMPNILALGAWSRGAGADLKAAKDGAYLENYLTSKGMSAKDARDSVPSALRYLNRADNVPDGIKETLHSGMSSFRPSEVVRKSNPVFGSPAMVFDTRQSAVDAIKPFIAKKSPGVSKKKLQEMASSFIEEVSPPTTSLGRFNSTQANSVLGKAKALFEASGKKTPSGMSALSGSLGRHIKRMLPVSIAIGAPLGIANALRVRKKRRDLAEIRAMYKTSEDGRTTTDRTLAAAPGIAAVPGFALGASSPGAFDPKTLLGDAPILGKSTGIRSRGVSGVIGAGALATAASLPGALRTSYKAVTGKPAIPEDAPVYAKKQASVSASMNAELLAIDKSASITSAFRSGMSRMGVAPPITKAMPSLASRSTAGLRLTRMIKDVKPATPLPKPLPKIRIGGAKNPKTIIPQTTMGHGDMSRGFKSYSELMQEGVSSGKAARMSSSAGTGGKIWAG